jgi:hypothetical protein
MRSRAWAFEAGVPITGTVGLLLRYYGGKPDAFKNALDELLACDPFGIKPLYYADDGATLQVASQVKALLNGGRIDTTPQPAGHVGFFLWGHVPEPYTLYKGIMD